MSKLIFHADSDEVERILTRANVEKPKPADMKALRKLFDERPDIWRHVGDLNNQATKGILDSFSGSGAWLESAERNVMAMREDMGRDNASPIERMLIDQVILTWLDYYRAQLTHTNKMQSGVSYAGADFAERRLSGAQRRHLRAITTLAKVRQMGPAGPMQINIAKNQRVYNALAAVAPDGDAGEE